ncbi:hypothetical protein CDL12_06302 [Handroanthus impetiginosus]|uniref:Leucine rich repeat protein n=1 Tax=Handroanthus impetiginosus TaxID=429701 RepID=A0A2G9HU05_9LAMI|nr:hypothetical protein CDL12_06302 [Handroanthus impetiginosus]
MESLLVRICIEAATESAAAVEKWRRQKRTLERMPSHLSEALLRHLLQRRLLFPSLLEVFKYSIEEIDLRGESCVDAEWMAYLGAFQYLRSMILADCHRINNSALWNITGMTNLKEVDLSRCSKITDAGIGHLLSVPALEKLCISETGVTADGVAALASLTNLLILDLGGLPVTDSAMSSLQALTKLQHLDLWGSEVSNEGAVLLKMFPSLSFLNLAWTSVTNLPNLSSLAYLNMSNCTIRSLFEGVGHKARMKEVMLSGAAITDVSEAFRYVETSRLHFLDLSYSSHQSFSFLRSMNALTDLNLSDSALTDESVEHIACIGTNIRYLNLSNTKVSSDGIGALFGHVPNLKTLLLSGTPIDDTAVSYISMMPSLKVINLSRTNVKGLIHQEGDSPHDVSSFSALKNLSHLEKLELEEVNITDAALFPLMNLDKLIYLSLRSVSLTDASLYHISSAPKLIHLGVRDAVLTDGGLDSFIPPPAMEILDIRGCWLLTKDVILRFCHNHPQVDVRHELAEALDKRNFHYSSPSRGTMRTSQQKHKQGKLSVSPHRSDDIFLDQRLRYTREELLALQFSSAAFSTSTHYQGN